MRPCGITRLADVTQLDRIGLPVFLAIRPNSRSLSTSQGKGIDADAARVSAMMEAIEGWHGERVVATGPYARRDEAEDIAGARSVTVSGLYRRGESTAGFEGRRSAWCIGTDLHVGGSALVPFDSVSTDFSEPTTANALIRTTNGLASGNTLTEATLHGLYEVIERDAVGRWALSDPAWTDVVDSTTLDSDNRDLVGAIADAGLVVALRILPSAFDVPVFAATIAPGLERPTPPHAAFSGYGAHLDPRVAASRALTEAVQSRLALISGSRDDLWPSEYSRVMDHRAATEWTESIIRADAEVDFSALTDQSGSTFDDDLKRLLGRLTERDVISVDLTREEIGVPVVKVIVTGTHGVPFDGRRRFGFDRMDRTSR
jgi:ribosomal protein S12 methylthiotransferase accessory factor